MFAFRTAHPQTGDPLCIEAVYHAPVRGLRDRYGAPIEPDDPEEIVICEAYDAAGERIDFTAIETPLALAARAFLHST